MKLVQAMWWALLKAGSPVLAKVQAAACLQRERQLGRIVVYDGSVGGTYDPFWCWWMGLGGDTR